MRNIVFIAIFAALAVALGLLFLSVPNLELVTATFFLAGYFLGRRNGITAAVLGEFTFSLLNPLGIASPPLMAAQIAGMALVAFAGSLIAKGKFTFHGDEEKFHIKQKLSLGAMGLVLTLIFDLLTSIGFLIFAGLTLPKLLTSLIFGMYYYLFHITTNMLIFAVLLPVIMPKISNRIFYPENTA